MRTTNRMIASLMLALGTTAAIAQAPPPGSEAGTVAPVSPPAPQAAPQPVPTAPPPPPAPSPSPTVPQGSAIGPAPQQGTPATVLDTSDYESVLGRGVRSAGGDELGRVIDVIIDKEGHPRAAIIDFGGFLGVGTRKIAVDWRALRFTADGKERRLSVALTRNQVRVSPEYKSGEPIVVLGPASGTPPEGDQAGTTSQIPAGIPAAPVPAPSAGSAPVTPGPAAPAPVPTPSPSADRAPDK